MSASLPTRFIRAPEAIRRFGAARVERLREFLLKDDPLADAVVETLVKRPRAEQATLIQQLVSGETTALPTSLRALEASYAPRPFWVDLERCNRGGAALLRTGALAGLVLALKSLVLGYCSPAGNKPLAFSGRLQADVERRLGETSRFVEAVCLPGGMARTGDGFAAALRVRLIHARVRHGLRHSSAWKHDDWGVPINQYDMAGTLLLFSSIVVDGLQQLGVTMTRDEEDDVMHLWRVVGWVMGVDAELTCTSLSEARELWRLLDATQADPDDDSRLLANALIGSQTQGSRGAWQGFLFAMSRHLVGQRYADALGYPKGRAWKLAPLMLRQVVKNIEATAKRVPGARASALRAGMTYWRRAVEGSRGDVSFPLPTEVKAEKRD